ncbi:hypothetical protein HMPREF0580_0331 [Mobiluncus mulieris ATCC 35239]|uniref:Uncharacterized protein n=1 Tax=Mobiluncus mulieris ATCC 35239 TaxID=871571 RepID=E0QN67_9ACTO|nr:hypothetical protein HMPREF0577_1967 [Mobiluncus mulieris ATCC 35243]EFM47019.1 hypothetical protein HMPREF0580_0331 [Mobiluncus mulieris ATCC 35239]
MALNSRGALTWDFYLLYPESPSKTGQIYQNPELFYCHMRRIPQKSTS